MQHPGPECGDVGYSQLAGKKAVLLTAPGAEQVFRAADGDLDQAAYNR